MILIRKTEVESYDINSYKRIIGKFLYLTNTDQMSTIQCNS